MGKKKKKWYDEPEKINVFADPLAILDECDDTSDDFHFDDGFAKDIFKNIEDHMDDDFMDSLLQNNIDNDPMDVLTKSEGAYTPQTEFGRRKNEDEPAPKVKTYESSIKMATRAASAAIKDKFKDNGDDITTLGANLKGISISADMFPSLGRIVIHDKLFSYNYDLSFIEAFDFDPLRVLLPGTEPELSGKPQFEADDIISFLFTELVFTSVPTAIFKSLEFETLFSKFGQVDNQKFAFATYNGYVFAYVLDESFSDIIINKIPSACGYNDLKLIQYLNSLAYTKVAMNNVCNLFLDNVVSALYSKFNNEARYFVSIVENDAGTVGNNEMSSMGLSSEETVYERMGVFDLENFNETVREMMSVLSADTDDDEEEEDDTEDGDVPVEDNVDDEEEDDTDDSVDDEDISSPDAIMDALEHAEESDDEPNHESSNSNGGFTMPVIRK